MCLYLIVRRIKEQHCYCAPDLAKEFHKYDNDPRKFFRKYTGTRVSTIDRLKGARFFFLFFLQAFLGLDIVSGLCPAE